MDQPEGEVSNRNQIVSTPREFLDAVEARFGEIFFDLAATRENSVCGPSLCYTEEDDSLVQAWGGLGRTWLNPPFRRILPWVKKASETSKQCGPLVLLPASVCTAWFRDYVAPFATVYELFPRVFKTEIRDCILADYRGEPARIPWKWR